jgi:thioredoxin-related protein
MKKAAYIFLCLNLLAFTNWAPDFETALKTAKEKNQLILLNFSGSDWCIPCIKMRKEIFDNNRFSDFADANLVLFNADFPRKKKNQLNEKIRKQNEELADKYNPNGKFPFTVLLDAGGKVIREWDGLPGDGVENFLKEIRTINDSKNK